MAYHVTTMTEHGDTPPAHPEGEDWSFALQRPNGELIFADTATELLSHVLDNYSTTQSSEHLYELRVDDAFVKAQQIQDLLLLDFSHRDPEAFSAFSDSDVLLSATKWPKHEHIDPSWIPEGGWSSDSVPPLVVISVLYTPYSTHILPAGDRVIVIDPYTEVGYLSSLSHLGPWRFYDMRDIEA